MNNFQISSLLEGYPVVICSANEVKYEKGMFVISNTMSSEDPGEHWVAFYFPKNGPNEFMDSMGNTPDYYDVGFEKVLGTYLMTTDRIQNSKSDMCGLYCIYYVMRRHAGFSMKTLLSIFNTGNGQVNDWTLRDIFIDNDT